MLKEASETVDERKYRGTAWAEFEGLPDAAKQKAADRVRALQMAEALHLAGTTHVHAMSQAARIHNVSTRTLYNWQEMVEGVAPEDRLASLVPRNRLAKRQSAKAICPAPEPEPPTVS